MSLVIGNKTKVNLDPGGSVTQSFSHTQNVGADGLIFATLTMPSTHTVVSATYGGQPLSIVSKLLSSISTRVYFLYAINPPTGNNTLTITYDSANWSGAVSLFVSSFTGATTGNFAMNGMATSPNSKTITVSQNSLLYATGSSTTAQSYQYSINGSNGLFEFSHTTGGGKIVRGAFSSLNLPVGNINVTTKADTGTVSNCIFEIKEVTTLQNDFSYLHNVGRGVGVGVGVGIG